MYSHGDLFFTSYKILAPEIMISEKDDKKAAEKTFEKAGLDPELFRCGKTKVSI